MCFYYLNSMDLTFKNPPTNPYVSPVFPVVIPYSLRFPTSSPVVGEIHTRGNSVLVKHHSEFLLSANLSSAGVKVQPLLG